MLSNIMTLCLRANDYDKAVLVMEKLDKGAHEVMGVPDVRALQLFIEKSVEQKSPTKAVNCLQYCVESGFTEAGKFGKYINDNMTLDEGLFNKVVNLVGKDVLQLDKNVE